MFNYQHQITITINYMGRLTKKSYFLILMAVPLRKERKKFGLFFLNLLLNLLKKFRLPLSSRGGGLNGTTIKIFFLKGEGEGEGKRIRAGLSDTTDKIYFLGITFFFFLFSRLII